MIIAIIDADIIGKSKHRFPNLACMKISAFYKKQGEVVLLKTDFKHLDAYDKIFISKVFTESFVPPFVLRQENVTFGGTGFFYDQAPTLPDKIEHIMPDYHLYDDWVQEKIRKGARQNEFKYYQDYSIEFLTRGCFRGCAFCVNRNYKQSKRHGNVYEFYDETRPKLCFLDDNFLACKDWKSIIEEVKGLNRRFQFKQVLDEHLLNDQIIDEIVSWKYEGDLIFAFDDIDDREIVESKLKIFHEKYPKRCKKK
ncbi:hypothetical protein [Eubacterium aggregans]|uniref:hypothetical protein n=1 Tax=Eubacterium aggregans TaxID=81409 RepID=UPI003F3C6F6A